MAEDDLRTYRSASVEPDGFDAFWAAQLREARSLAAPPEVTEVETELTTIRTWDVAFSGWGGQRIRAWLRLPADAAGPMPTVVQYIGYGGGRGSVLDELVVPAAGFAHLLMDTRGQGSVWSAGDTPDDAPAGPQIPGVMTRGITAPETYYYTRFFTDAALAVDAARAMPQVDGDRIGLYGISQGGGTAIAASVLADGVRAVAARVPFLCDFPRSITITDTLPFHEIVAYLAVHRDQTEAVLRTLSHVDVVHFASRGRAPLTLTTALMDAVVPPSGPFAAYNAYPGPKELTVHRFNGHEGGGPDDVAAALRFFREHLG